MPAESGPLVVIASSIWVSSSPRRGWRPGFLRWRPTIPHIRRPRSSALTIRVYAQETSFHYRGIVGRDAASGQQPVTAGAAAGVAVLPAAGLAAGLAAGPAVVRGGTAHGPRAGVSTAADSALGA